jgi:hypothetical protein
VLAHSAAAAVAIGRRVAVEALYNDRVTAILGRGQRGRLGFPSRSEMLSKTAVPLEAKLTENPQFSAKDRRLLISGSQVRVLLRPP